MSAPDLTTFQKIIPIYLQNYERYLPTAFDESLSLLEKINKVIEQMNKVGELSNNLLDKWKEVMEWIIGEGLEIAVNEKLNEWLLDGTIDQIINENLFNDLKDLIDLKAEKMDVDSRTINVRFPPAPLMPAEADGETDDTSALRAIIEYAESNNRKILIPGICVITGELEIKEQIIIEGVGTGAGYSNTLPQYQQISGFLVKGNGVKRVRTRVNYRGSSSDPEDAPLSVALNIQAEFVKIKDLTVFLDFDRVDNSPTNYGANWDVGIFIGCRVHNQLENVHVLGYWREASIWHDVTRADNLPQFNDINGVPYPVGTVRHGADGLTLIKVFTKGGKWGLKIQGAMPKAGATGYSDGYYDTLFGGVITDRRGTFGSSDVTALACSFYGMWHHSLWRRHDSTGNYLNDNGGGCLSIDGLAGNASGMLQGMRFLSCRFASFDPYRIKLDRANRVDFIGCHSEWGSTAYSSTGQQLTFSDSEVYGPISTTDNTDNLVMISFNATVRDQFIGAKKYTSVGSPSTTTHNRLNKQLDVNDSLTVTGYTKLGNPIEFTTEADIRSLDSSGIRFRLGTVTKLLIDAINTKLYGHVLPNAHDSQSLGSRTASFTEAHVKNGVYIRTQDGTKTYLVRVDNNGNVITQLQS